MNYINSVKCQTESSIKGRKGVKNKKVWLQASKYGKFSHKKEHRKIEMLKKIEDVIIQKAYTVTHLHPIE